MCFGFILPFQSCKFKNQILGGSDPYTVLAEYFENKCVLDSYYPFNCESLKIEFWVRSCSLTTSSRMNIHMVS